MGIKYGPPPTKLFCIKCGQDERPLMTRYSKPCGCSKYVCPEFKKMIWSSIDDDWIFYYQEDREKMENYENLL